MQHISQEEQVDIPDQVHYQQTEEISLLPFQLNYKLNKPLLINSKVLVLCTLGNNKVIL